jgi:NAD(P)-dependent dehydrogenase (short-subunit alcohol dehydrogenase family)
VYVEQAVGKGALGPSTAKADIDKEDMMDLGLEGKVAIVTGASSGIGKATALKFAQEGAKVALVARRAEELEKLAGDIKADGGQALSVAADVTKQEDCKRVVEQTVEAFGGVDVLVNAAGIIATGTIENLKLDDWDYMMNINVSAPFYLTQQALPYLIAAKGSVVHVSSVTGIRAFPGVLSYCVSKAAVTQLTYCSALELAPKGVRVNAVCPGVVRTQLHRTGYMNEEQYAKFLEHSKTTHPLGRVGEPEEVADLIAFLASPKAGWITGEAVAIDGGRAQTCAR